MLTLPLLLMLGLNGPLHKLQMSAPVQSSYGRMKVIEITFSKIIKFNAHDNFSVDQTYNQINFLENILGSLEEKHLRALAKRITSEQDILDLDLNVLQLPGYKVDSALYNKRDIELATYEAPKTWRNKQDSPKEAYENLRRDLLDHGWKQLANELREWVTHSSTLARKSDTSTTYPE